MKNSCLIQSTNNYTSISNRGNFKEENSNNQTRLLDNVARIFSKGEYTAVIRIGIQDILYISFPENMRENANVQKRYDLTQDKINELAQSFKAFLAEPSMSENQIALFELMYNNDNATLKKFIIKLKTKIAREGLKSATAVNQYNYNDFHNKQDISPNNKDVFKDFVISNYQSFFGKEEDLNVLLNNSLVKNSFVKVPISVGYDNVHAEAKGIHFANKEHPDSPLFFFIGLANNSGLDIGCCGGCFLEFQLLEQNNYSIYRTRDFPENKPQKKYCPSPNIKYEDYEKFRDIGINITQQIGQGFDNYKQQSYWFEYSKDAMEALLKLRIKSISLDNEIEIFSPNYIFDGFIQSAREFAIDICLKVVDKTLINLNLFNKHWVGIALEKTAKQIDINYMDSEQQPMPVLLQENILKTVTKAYPHLQVYIMEAELEVQKYNNCGPEVIENFMQYLIGHRLSQEDAVPIHALLYEDSLMLAGDC